MKDLFLHMEWWRWVLLCTVMPALVVGAIFFFKRLYKDLFRTPQSEEKRFDRGPSSSWDKDNGTYDSGASATAAGSAAVFTAANI